MTPTGLMAASPHLAMVTWLLTYLLHSTVILAGVWLLTRGGLLSRAHQRAFLWKAGVLAGVFTASVQVSVTSFSAVPSQQAIHEAGAPVAAHLTWTARVESATGSPVSIRQSARTPASSPACGQALEGSLFEARLRLADPVRPFPAPSAAEVEALVEQCGGAGTGRWPWVLLGLWAVGALFGGGLLLRHQRRFSRALTSARSAGGEVEALLERIRERAGSSSPVRLLEASSLGTPVALSGRRIVLPSYAVRQLDRDELTAVLAHEVGHLVRRDPGWLRMLRVLEVILWMQPLNRLARRAFQEASEFLADGWAVRHTRSRLPLARSLEKVSRWSLRGDRPSGVLAMARPESPLVERVRAILATPDAGSAPGASPWSVLLLVPALFLPPVRVPEPEGVRVLVVREVRGASTAVPPSDAPAVDADRMEVRVYRLSESPGRSR